MKKSTLAISIVVLAIVIFSGVAWASWGKPSNWFHRDDARTDTTPVKEIPAVPATPLPENSTAKPPVSSGDIKPAIVEPIVIQAAFKHIYTMFGVEAIVDEVLEDSRCPAQVECIQAGTVRVSVHASYKGIGKDVAFTLGEPRVYNGYSVTLTQVGPERTASAAVTPAEYVFTFSIKSIETGN